MKKKKRTSIAKKIATLAAVLAIVVALVPTIAFGADMEAPEAPVEPAAADVVIPEDNGGAAAETPGVPETPVVPDEPAVPDAPAAPEATPPSDTPVAPDAPAAQDNSGTGVTGATAAATAAVTSVPTDAVEDSVDALEPGGDAQDVLFDVYFYAETGEELLHTQVQQGAALAPPASDPDAPEGAVFAGWFEENAAEPYRFEESAVTGELKLYAKFEPEEAAGEPAAEAPAPVDAQGGEDELLAATEAEDELDETDVEHIVTFMANGAVYYTDSVLHETLVCMPASDPEGENGAHFVGWFTADGLPFNQYQLITGDLELNAKFNETNAVVTYLDTDGSVLDVVEGVIGEPLPATDKLPTLLMGQKFLHWAKAGGKAAFTGNLTGNLTLEPVVSEVAIAVFITNGSEIEPQTGAGDEFYATAPATPPTRDGYTFDGWSPNADGTGDFNFAEPIKGKVFIYARWEAAEANYTLNVWVEAANAGTLGDSLAGSRAGYELRYTTVQTAETDTKVKPSDTEIRKAVNAADTAVRDLLTYSTWKASEEQEISGNGDTVINVFYTRTVFTFNFDVTAQKGEIFLVDDTSVGASYQLKLKLDQDVTAIWPSKVTFADTSLYFTNWSGFYGNNSSKVSYSHLSVAFSAPTAMQPNWYYDKTTPKRFEVTLTPRTEKNPYTETRVYWVELTDAELATYKSGGSVGAEVRTRTTGNAVYGGLRYYKNFVTAGKNNQTADPAKNARGWPGRDITGFETIGSTSGTCRTTEFQDIVLNSGRDYTLNYFMPRKASTLTLVTGLGTIANDGTFKGGGGSYTATVKYGEPFTGLVPATAARANHAFDGWYLDEYGMQPFTGGTMPDANVTLYAKYRGTDVTVLYTDGENVATRTYEREQKLNNHELAGTLYDGAKPGDRIPGKGIFTGWYYDVGAATVEFPLGLSLTRENYVLKAQLTPVNYTVTYKGVDEDGENVTYDTQTVRSGENNTLARSGHTRLAPPAREGYAFKGWATATGATAADFNTATRILDNTTVYAVWAPIQVALVYDANGGATTPANLRQVVNYGQSLQDASLALCGADSVALAGSSFEGWFTAPDGGQLFDASTRLTTDRTVYAHWSETGEQPGGDTPDAEDETPPAAPVTPDSPDAPDGPNSTPATPEDKTPDGTTPVTPVTPVTPIIPVTPATADGETPATADGETPVTPDAVTPDAGGLVPAPLFDIPAPALLTEVVTTAPAVLNTPAAAIMQALTPSATPTTSINHDEVPLGGFGQTGAWSFLSLLMALTAFMISLLLALGALVRRKREEEHGADAEHTQKSRKYRSWLIRPFAVVLGILPAVLFLVLDDISLPMVLVNHWTPWIALAFIVHLAGVAVYYIAKRREDGKGQDEARQTAE